MLEIKGAPLAFSTLYSYEDLSQEAQEQAFFLFKERIKYPFDDINMKTIFGFLKHFGLSLLCYEYDMYNYTYLPHIEDRAKWNAIQKLPINRDSIESLFLIRYPKYSDLYSSLNPIYNSPYLTDYKLNRILFYDIERFYINGADDSQHYNSWDDLAYSSVESAFKYIVKELDFLYSYKFFIENEVNLQKRVYFENGFSITKEEFFILSKKYGNMGTN